jgi:hypothetical protein
MNVKPATRGVVAENKRLSKNNPSGALVLARMKTLYNLVGFSKALASASLRAY